MLLWRWRAASKVPSSKMHIRVAHCNIIIYVATYIFHFHFDTCTAFPILYNPVANKLFIILCEDPFDLLLWRGDAFLTVSMRINALQSNSLQGVRDLCRQEKVYFMQNYYYMKLPLC